MSASDERREMDEKPVGERPQDIRARTEVIVERDAKHLADEDRYGTDRIEEAGDTPAPEGAGDRRTRARTPDGRPYADSQDPDGQSDGIANTGDGSLP